MPLYNGFMRRNFGANKFIGGHADDQLPRDPEAWRPWDQQAGHSRRLPVFKKYCGKCSETCSGMWAGLEACTGLEQQRAFREAIPAQHGKGKLQDAGL